MHRSVARVEGRECSFRLDVVVSAKAPRTLAPELQSSAPARNSRLLSAGIQASPPSTDQTPAIEGSGVARTPTTLTMNPDERPSVPCWIAYDAASSKLPNRSPVPAAADQPTTLTRPRETAPRVLPYACPAALTRSARGAPVVSDVVLRVRFQTTGRGDLCGAAFIGLGDHSAATALVVGCESEPVAERDSRTSSNAGASLPSRRRPHPGESGC